MKHQISKILKNPWLNVHCLLGVSAMWSQNLASLKVGVSIPDGTGQNYGIPQTFHFDILNFWWDVIFVSPYESNDSQSFLLQYSPFQI